MPGQRRAPNTMVSMPKVPDRLNFNECTWAEVDAANDANTSEEQVEEALKSAV
jgi:hypothetical protein